MVLISKVLEDSYFENFLYKIAHFLEIPVKVIAMPQPPSLSEEQRAEALAKAAEARRQRAELKSKLKIGTLTLAELLKKADSDDIIGKMKVISVLESLPGLGKIKARKLMEELGISETRRLQGLGAKQKEALLEVVSR